MDPFTNSFLERFLKCSSIETISSEIHHDLKLVRNLDKHYSTKYTEYLENVELLNSYFNESLLQDIRFNQELLYNLRAETITIIRNLLHKVNFIINTTKTLQRIVENNIPNSNNDSIDTDIESELPTTFTIDTNLLPSLPIGTLAVNNTNTDYTTDNNDFIFCYCRRPDKYDTMIECSNKNCPIQWFHCVCVGFSNDNQIPGENEEWFCPICKYSDNNNKEKDNNNLEISLHTDTTIGRLDINKNDNKYEQEQDQLIDLESLYAEG